MPGTCSRRRTYAALISTSAWLTPARRAALAISGVGTFFMLISAISRRDALLTMIESSFESKTPLYMSIVETEPTVETEATDEERETGGVLDR